MHIQRIVIGAIIVSAGVALAWSGDRRQPLDYGNTGDVFLEPSDLAPGQPFELCFRKINWKRLCPSELRFYALDSHGVRHDYPGTVHYIRPPKDPGPLPHVKCRPIDSMPTLPQLPPGATTLVVDTTSNCDRFTQYRWPIWTPVPEVHFTTR